MRTKHLLWSMVTVLLVAAALRLVAAGQVPPGLYHDEAYNGLDALDILQGHLPLYFAANNGREPLFIYLVGAAVGLLGPSPLAARLPAFFVGALTIAATCAAGRALFSRRVGLLSAAALAVTLWHVHLSRVSFRAVALPLFIALTVWQGALGARRKKGARRHWIAAGVFYGLTFYTYTAARFTPVALAAFGLYLWATRPEARDWRRARPLALAALAAALTLAPLAAYAAQYPDVVLGRPGQVSVFSPEIHGGHLWRTLGLHTLRALGMFLVRGDRIWRHNVPWRPVFDPLLGTAFLGGIALALRRARRDAAAGFTLIWTAAMLLPTILAEDAPHFLRAVGVLPLAAVFPALGLDGLAEIIGRRLAPRSPQEQAENGRQALCNSALQQANRSKRAQGPKLLGGEGTVPLLRTVLIALPLAFGLFSTGRAYFGDYARDPTTAYWFEQGAVGMAGRVNAFLDTGWDGGTMRRGDPGDRQVYLDPILWETWPQARFLIAAQERATVGLDGAPCADCRVAVFAWPYGDWQQAWNLLPAPAEIAFEEGPLSQGDRDAIPYTTYLAIFAAPPEANPPALARFAGGVELLGVEATPRDGRLRVRLRWRAAAPLAEDYTVFLHYLRDGERIAQADSPPAGGRYPTSQWRPGDIIHDDHWVSVAEPLPGRDGLRFGFWLPENGTALAVLDETGNPSGEWIEVAVGE